MADHPEWACVNADGLNKEDLMPYKTIVLTDTDVIEDELKTALMITPNAAANFCFADAKRQNCSKKSWFTM